jgi:phage baseplate assembly protein W
MTFDSRDFLGTGWAFPVDVDASGGIALVSAEQAIERSIHVILGTAKGERRMRPEFGCGIHDLVFMPNDPTTHGLIETQVADALAWWEPRIEIAGVAVDQHPDDEGALLVHISYVIRTTNAARTLVYPFYLIPGEE